MTKGDGRSLTLWVRSDHESVLKDARLCAKDNGMSFSELVFRALEEYMTRHQIITVVPGRARTLTAILAENELKRRLNGL